MKEIDKLKRYAVMQGVSADEAASILISQKAREMESSLNKNGSNVYRLVDYRRQGIPDPAA
ncbi:hypothetical protein [Gayadomonas joobiniege]|uniref:hypothetical protein n=1 Tax=Gayadomonas joobiniege TaxID=1234606 RepID=UPI00036D3E74|nr:hypothetical protein [Gayadomonas joobiniege]